MSHDSSMYVVLKEREIKTYFGNFQPSCREQHCFNVDTLVQTLWFHHYWLINVFKSTFVCTSYSTYKPTVT